MEAFWGLSQKPVFRSSLYAFGIMASLVVYGLLQERIMTQPYGGNQAGEEPVFFRNSAYLVLNNRIIAVLISIILIHYHRESYKNQAPLYKCGAISLSNTVATYCQYEALKYVSFPTQTLGKCGKMIPVMILGLLLSSKKYGLKDFFIAAAVSSGCALFILTGEIGYSKQQTDTIYGLVLMGIYLFSDAFTSTFQEKLFHGYNMSTYNQMLYVNLCSALLSLGSLVLNQEFISSIQFSFAHLDFMMNSLFLSMSSTLGQLIILLTIKEFGALFFATVMTVRQVISILLSCLIYLHPLSYGQWISAILVFGIIYYKDSSSTRHRHHAPKETELPTSTRGGSAPAENITIVLKN